MSDHQSPEVGRPIPDSTVQLSSLSPVKTSDPNVVHIILVGDISKPPRNAPKNWGLGTEFFWPGKIPNAVVSEFSHDRNAVATPTNREDIVKFLAVEISLGRLKEHSRKLQEDINKSSAEKLILVGYGYGGLLCEQVIVDSKQDSPKTGVIKGLVLFGTPHFVHGLRQWARIVVETRVQSDVSLENRGTNMDSMKETIGRVFSRGKASSEELADLEKDFGEIANIQQEFFNKTKDNEWSTRIASCFPVSSSPTTEHKLSILPEWSTVPHAMPVSIHRPYLEMTAFGGDSEEGYRVISRLIGKWIEGTNDGNNNNNSNVTNTQEGSSQANPGEVGLKAT